MGHSLHRKILLPFAMLAAAPAAAQWGPPQGNGPSASYSFLYADGGLYQDRNSLSIDAPLGQAAGAALRGAASFTSINSSGGGYLPANLYKEELRLSARKNNLSAAMFLNSNSDRPFNSPTETDLGVNLNADLAEPGTRGAWLLGVNYSTRRSFMRGMPMPYISYRYTTDKFMFMLPFMLRWQPRKDLSLSASWQPVKYYRLALAWRPAGPFSAELEGGTGLEQFLVAGRADKGDALYLQTSSLMLKPAVKLARRAELGATLGWRFKGLYYTGSRYDDYHYRRRFGGGPAAGLQFKYSF